MGCQFSKQSENAKTTRSKLSKPDAKENIAGEPVIEKLRSERSSKEAVAENEELNDEVGNVVPEGAGLKLSTIVSRSAEPNEEAVGNRNQLKRNKLHKHESERSPNNNRRPKDLGETLNRKYLLNNSKQLQIRTKTKRSRANPEDDTLYEVPLRMPEFDLVPSRSEDSVAQS
ncbi:unnamed protein product [Litomosoides sigmodontis]|uniref:Uncharacterized protein n=1 Tax=Litomosoides sigmodontis TaxID=42156 RepID=A0A3P6TRX9_LITSI|nr:unnamed protein product [Litomosoides sigmodontis]